MKANRTKERENIFQIKYVKIHLQAAGAAQALPPLWYTSVCVLCDPAQYEEATSPDFQVLVLHFIDTFWNWLQSESEPFPPGQNL